MSTNYFLTQTDSVHEKIPHVVWERLFLWINVAPVVVESSYKI